MSAVSMEKEKTREAGTALVSEVRDHMEGAI